MIWIDDLFRACKDIDLPRGKKGMARALTDPEAKERRRYAVLVGREAQKELEDETSLWHRSYVAPLEEGDDPEPLIQQMLETRRFELIEEAELRFPLTFLPIPDNATNVEERQVLDKREEQENTIREQRQKHVESRMDEIRQKLEALEFETLRDAAVKASVDVAVYSVYAEAIQWYSVYAGIFVYDEDGALKRKFASPDEARGLTEAVLSRLYGEVAEVNNVDPWEVQKNS